MTMDLSVTLWPHLPHFGNFSRDARLAGIRMNSAMIAAPDLSEALAHATRTDPTVPLWFDVKGRQPRVVEVHPNDDRLELTLNHPIKVRTPTVVLFKAGADRALLERVEDGGRRLLFRGGPHYNVRAGESLHIREPGFRIDGPLFTDIEREKIAIVRAAGITRWYLSYVEKQSDIDEFRELVGRDAEIVLKIETEKGLDFMARRYHPQRGVRPMAARGDLYVEIAKPHKITEALRLIVEKDRDAMVGSRLLLSVINGPVPSCADWCELEMLRMLGYRSYLLCDELCLHEAMLSTAVNAFHAFRTENAAPTPPTRPVFRPEPTPARKGFLERLFG